MRVQAWALTRDVRAASGRARACGADEGGAREGGREGAGGAAGSRLSLPVVLLYLLPAPTGSTEGREWASSLRPGCIDALFSGVRCHVSGLLQALDSIPAHMQQTHIYAHTCAHSRTLVCTAHMHTLYTCSQHIPFTPEHTLHIYPRTCTLRPAHSHHSDLQMLTPAHTLSLTCAHSQSHTSIHTIAHHCALPNMHTPAHTHTHTHTRTHLHNSHLHTLTNALKQKGRAEMPLGGCQLSLVSAPTRVPWGAALVPEPHSCLGSNLAGLLLFSAMVKAGGRVCPA